MSARYISVYAKDVKESHQYQEVLFSKGFEWVTSGKSLTDHTNFYARLDDMKIITCYHDASIDEESIKLSIEQITSFNIKQNY